MANTKVRFTDSWLRELQPLPGRPRIVYDDGDVRGFAIQVTPAGTKTFLLCYVAKASGRERRMVIGPYGRAPALSLSAARERAIELRSQVNAGRDPWQELKDQREAAAAKKATESATLGGLLDAYCESLERDRKASAPGVRRELKATVATPFPSLWKRPAVDVTLDDLLKPINRLVREGKLRQAEKTRAYIRAAYAAAAASRANPSTADLFEPYAKLPNIGRDLTTVTRPKVDDHAEEAPERALTQPELAAYWRRIAAMSGPEGAALRFHLLTGGQRAPQLARAIESRSVDRAILLLDPKGRRKKARRHMVPLIDDAEAAMQDMRGADPAGPYLLTLNGGRTAIGYHRLRNLVRQVADAMVAAGEIAEPFTPGDLRVTVETLLAAAGVPKETRAQLQSHGLGGVQDRHYDEHKYMDEKRAALEKLRALCEPIPDNVTSITKRSRASG